MQYRHSYVHSILQSNIDHMCTTGTCKRNKYRILIMKQYAIKPSFKYSSYVQSSPQSNIFIYSTSTGMRTQSRSQILILCAFIPAVKYSSQSMCMLDFSLLDGRIRMQSRFNLSVLANSRYLL